MRGNPDPTRHARQHVFDFPAPKGPTQRQLSRAREEGTGRMHLVFTGAIMDIRAAWLRWLRARASPKGPRDTGGPAAQM